MASKQNVTGRRWRLLSLSVLAVAMLLLLGAAWHFWWGGKSRTGADDPRLTIATPFKNVRPEVQYVGDAVCTSCHREIAETYRRHSMGQSVFPVASAPELERYTEDAHNPFDALGYRHWVERRDGRVLHHEAAKDSMPQVHAEAEVHLAVGSGNHGRSYLIDRQGYLFLSSITWYPQKGSWDLSPGFDQGHQHFGRAAQAECLFCHVNSVTRIGDTLNRYENPRLQASAIGCERCHGPGELHVAAAGSAAGVDYTIVNPRHLEPPLREAICQQCHLEGKIRVLRKGREHFDYRPGLPLHAFLSVFVEAESPAADRDFVGHVEQMHASRCYQGSAGKLGCVSCHDPHRLPAESEKSAYYRAKCVVCHADPGCSLPKATRLETSSGDSCIQCHMPAGETNIAHTTIADHRVPRRSSKSQPTAARRPSHASEPIRLSHFHGELLGPTDADASRELGIALMELAGRESDFIRPKYGQLALSALEAAVAADPDDIPAGQAKALALWMRGRKGDAVALFEKLLAKAPKRENLLEQAATLATEMNNPELSRSYWRRALSVNPYHWRYYQGLATAQAQAQEWREAASSCLQALELNPFSTDVRVLLVTCRLQLGQKQQARTEFDLLLSLHPPDEASLRRRFTDSLR